MSRIGARWRVGAAAAHPIRSHPTSGDVGPSDLAVNHWRRLPPELDAGALVRPVTPSSTGSEPGNSFLHPAAP